MNQASFSAAAQVGFGANLPAARLSPDDSGGEKSRGSNTKRNDSIPNSVRGNFVLMLATVQKVLQAYCYTSNEMLPFSIHIEDGSPASDQLVQAVRRAILRGDLQDGDRFPSVRSLSQELRISPTTAHKAVALLKAEGLLGAQPGVGMVVRTNELPSTEQRLSLLTPDLKQAIREAKALQLSEETLSEHIRKLWKETF